MWMVIKLGESFLYLLNFQKNLKSVCTGLTTTAKKMTNFGLLQATVAKE